MVQMMLSEPLEGHNTFAKLLNASALRHEAPAAHRNRIELLHEALRRETKRVLAESGTAKVLNLGCGPAELSEGASADIVSLCTDHIALEGRSGDGILDAWIFAAREPAVDCVWVRGAKQVAGGRHRHRDNIEERFRVVMRRLAG